MKSLKTKRILENQFFSKTIILTILFFCFIIAGRSSELYKNPERSTFTVPAIVSKAGLPFTAKNVIISSRNQQISIKSKVESIDKIFVYDILGREIYKKIKVDANAALISDLNEQQILIVKVVLANGQSVSKKVIN